MTLVPGCESGLGPPRIPGLQLLRDTFAGKILITFQNQIPVSKFLSNFYRQKCRAAAEILGAWEGYELP